MMRLGHSRQQEQEHGEETETGYGHRTHCRQKPLIVKESINIDTKSFTTDVCLGDGGVSKNATTDRHTEYRKIKVMVLT